MKPIADFPGYSITTDGRVWSHHRKGTCGLWCKQTPRGDVYLRVELWKNSKKYWRKVHRLVLETYVGPCPKGMECRHLNGNPADNRLENLQWGTRSENQQDSVKHGTHACCKQIGESHPRSKITNQQRRQIIYQFMTGLFTQRQLAREYSAHYSTIWDILRGRVWPYVDTRKLHV